jgi:hypothetical protein
MKPETSRTKKGIAIALGTIALFMVTRTLLSRGGSAPRPAAPAAIASGKGKTAPAAESLDPRLRLDLLANSESVVYEGAGKNIFRAAPEVVIPRVKVPPLLPSQSEIPLPVMTSGSPLPPPINLKFFGYSSGKGERPKAFLSHGDDIWIAQEGDVVNRQYRIVRITPTTVEVEDLLNNNRQSIQLIQG